jgi:acetyl-CoA carboxylase alpha subunit
MAETLRDFLLKHLGDLLKIPAPERLRRRYAKFRAFGHFAEPEAPAKAGVAG